MSAHGPMPRSAWIFPVLAVILFAATTALRFTFAPSPSGLVFAAALLVILFGTVFAAVHHAEVIADRIGEPYGTLLLTLAVTIIEVALIATIMLGEKPVPTLARDTVFAVVMIVCNGLVGICIMAGGLRYREQDVQVAGSNLYLSVLIGAPPAFAGILVALLILLPESVAAIAAARKNDLQKSINLALGSSIATIGLTIPAVAITAYTLDMQLVLGLNEQEVVLLVLTFLLSMLTFVTGRTNILFGLVHLVVFAVFVLLVFVP